MLTRTGLRIPTMAAMLVLATGCAGAQETGAATPPAVPPSPSMMSTQAPAPVDVMGVAPEWTTVGTSIEGRPIRTRSFGYGPREVLFIGGIHGDENEGSYTTAQLPDAFLAAGLEDVVTLTILENANPDGTAAGRRVNTNGVDVNRNFPAKNFDPSNGGTPLSQPESRAVVQTIDAIGPALVIVAHSWAGDQFINFDGPARELAERFSASSGLPVEASSEFAPTPGSLGSYIGRDRGIPVLTVEVLKGSDPKAVWETLRPALLQAIGG